MRQCRMETVPCQTGPYATVPYEAVPYEAGPYATVPWILRYETVPCATVLNETKCLTRRGRALRDRAVCDSDSSDGAVCDSAI